MRVIAILICFAAGTFLCLRGAAVAGCFFMWNEIFRPLDFAWSPDLFPAAHLVVATLLASLFMTKNEYRWNRTATVLCLMIPWMFIAAFFGRDRRVSMEYAIYAVKFLVPILIISLTLTRRWSQNLFLYTLAASVGLWAAQSGITCLLSGPQPTMSIRGGQMSDRNDFVAGIVTAVPLLAYLASTYAWKHRRYVRAAAKVVIGLSVVAILFSLSRGGMLGSAVTFMYFMLLTGRMGKKLVLGAVVIMGAIALTPQVVTDRLSTIEMSTEEQTESSAAARLRLAKIGIEMTLDHPITGVGPANFPWVANSVYGNPTQHDPHNIWLKCSAEYGFPMLSLFVLTIVFLLRNLSKIRRRAKAEGDTETEQMSIALACSIVGFLATTTFLSQFMSEYFWALCGLTGAFIAHQRARGPESPAETPDPTREPATAGV